MRIGAMAACENVESVAAEAFFSGQKEECSMCGDVGFADQLQHCTCCKWRVQHSYCCISTEGVETGAWLCDWCRLQKQCLPKKDFRRCKPHPIIVKPRTVALDFLVKVALSRSTDGDSELTEDFNTLKMDCGSCCSSSLECDKGGCDKGVQDHVQVDRETSSSCEEGLTTSADDGSLGSPGMGSNDSKKKPNWLKCTKKLAKQTSVPGFKFQLSSSPQLEPRKQKKLSSLKTLRRPRISPPVDGHPKGFTPRFKSLSSICC